MAIRARRADRLSDPHLHSINKKKPPEGGFFMLA
jgi:hypothetical protein